MPGPAVTLLASNAHWAGVAWTFGDRRVQRCTIKQVLAASTSQSFSAMPLERIIIEGPLQSSEFLVLLSTLHPSFTGDVLFIHRADGAFLSARADGGPRVMYTLSKADIDFYVDVNGLRRRGEETSFQLVSQSASDGAGRRGMQVLIAQGDRRTVRSVTSILNNLGCQPLVAESGQDALQLVEHCRPDVLLLDETARSVRHYVAAHFAKSEDHEYRPRTIVVSRCDEKPADGFDGCLVKPVAFDRIGAAIFG
jgi:CheY-like chemotaxis protein